MKEKYYDLAYQAAREKAREMLNKLRKMLDNKNPRKKEDCQTFWTTQGTAGQNLQQVRNYNWRDCTNWLQLSSQLCEFCNWVKINKFFSKDKKFLWIF